MNLDSEILAATAFIRSDLDKVEKLVKLNMASKTYKLQNGLEITIGDKLVNDKGEECTFISYGVLNSHMCFDFDVEYEDGRKSSYSGHMNFRKVI